MKSKTIIPLAVGLTVGIFAVSRGLNYIKSVKGAAGTTQTVSVVTAMADIPQGVAITTEMVNIKEVPKELAPRRLFSKPEEVLERVPSMMIPKDMPVLPTMLSPKGTAPGLGAKIPDGMRAVAVKVDEWSAVGGWLKPGVRVDVAAVFKVQVDRMSKTISKIILQNIEVAAVGGAMGQNPQDTGASVSKSVTLIVKPSDVAKLHLASTKGKIRLAMRNSLDDQNENVVAQDEDELFGEGNKGAGAQAMAGLFQRLLGLGKGPEPVQFAEASSRCMVDLINGGRRERKVYKDKNSMELIGFEGTTASVLDSQARPYGQSERRRTSNAPRQGSWRIRDAGAFQAE